MNTPTKDELIEYINNNIPYTEIAKIYNVSDVTIRCWIEKMGIQLPKRKILLCNREKHFCLSCQKEIDYRKTYCSNKCQQEYKHKKFIETWKSGNNEKTTGAWQDTSVHIRNYIVEKYNNKCGRCGWCEVNPYTKNTPLELEHIDGNHENNDESNLILLCPNCHSLTKHYKGANKGKGRNKRYKRSLKMMP